ncbi:MAG: hypothetical protein KKF65_04090 [Nanoarchaeota archaeon]|nr:hypothetical protein [Nanoarchaeota archaeon]
MLLGFYNHENYTIEFWSKMLNLETSVDKLLPLFPRSLDGLDVVLLTDSSTYLVIKYVQRNCEDPYRNEESAEIYRRNRVFTKNGLINENDKILLDLTLQQWKYVHLSNVTVYLSTIQRHPDPQLKGLGEEYYQNFIKWLRTKGYKYLIISPLERMESYWKELGQVPFESLKPEKVQLLKGYTNLVRLHVHFLYEEDKHEFMKPS